MKILIGSDIHGSLKYARMFMKKAEKIKADRIVILGDFYYNGARNDPPEEYCPKEVVKLMNSYAKKLIAIKGNCESEVDQMVSDFTFCENSTLVVFDKKITLTHGHHLNFDNVNDEDQDIFIQGHTHISVLEKRGELIIANPGSVSLPKDGRHSYMIMDETGLALYDLLDDSLVKKIEF